MEERDLQMLERIIGMWESGALGNDADQAPKNDNALDQKWKCRPPSHYAYRFMPFWWTTCPFLSYTNHCSKWNTNSMNSLCASFVFVSYFSVRQLCCHCIHF